jgi:ADP-heptose:LPS heptosyltransferase
MRRPRRLLVLRALGLGDLLTAVPALRALAGAFPEHRTLLAAPAALEPLARMTGAIDEVVDAHGLAPLPPSLAGVELAVDLHGRGPESQRLLTALAPGRLWSFAHAEVPESAGGPTWRAEEHEVTRWCRMVAHFGPPADPRCLDLQPPSGPAPTRAAGATILHPGAASAARRWPAARFAAVGAWMARRGEKVLVTAGPGEEPLACEVALRAGLPHDSVVSPDLTTLVRLVAVGSRVLCGDTGVAHLATALRRPSVVLFGPTPPELWGPPPDRPSHVALWAGRRGDPHGTLPDPGLLRIGVDQVIEALETLPEEAAATPPPPRRLEEAGARA